MKIAMLAPVAWRTPPKHYGPWENVVSLITEGLVQRGIDVTLFATQDSQTSGKLAGVVERGYEEDKWVEPKVVECLHIAHCMEEAKKFDLIHNHFDFLPLTFKHFVKTPMVTTIHGFSSPKIIPVYKRYQEENDYIAISDADRSSELSYRATIHHGIDLEQFTFEPRAKNRHLLFFSRMHHDKGAKEAIAIAKKAELPLIMAGIIQDQAYYESEVKPHLGEQIRYIGSVGPKDRDELLGNALGLIHSINFAEPFGLSVIESFACGTPVIAMNRGSMPELITHSEDGFLVQTVDEAVACVRRLPQISRKACRLKVESRFSRDVMVDKYVEVYKAILKEQS